MTDGYTDEFILNTIDIDAVFRAACEDDVETIRRFASAGANLNMSAYKGSFLLRNAVQTGSLKALRALLELGANPNEQFDYYSPVTKKTAEKVSALFYVSGVESAKLLVEFGADVNIRDAKGSTPLMWAANYSDAGLIEYLLQEGADASVQQVKARGRKAWTALEIAERNLASWESICREQGGEKLLERLDQKKRMVELLQKATSSSKGTGRSPA